MKMKLGKMIPIVEAKAIEAIGDSNLDPNDKWAAVEFANSIGGKVDTFNKVRGQALAKYGKQTEAGFFDLGANLGKFNAEMDALKEVEHVVPDLKLPKSKLDKVPISALTVLFDLIDKSK